METTISKSKKFLTAKSEVSVALTPARTRCLSDGSWVGDWHGGFGMVLFEDDKLVLHKSRAVRACCPLQSEALALREGIQVASRIGLTECSFCTDCKELCELVNQKHPPLDADWRVFKEVQDIWMIMQDNQGYKCSLMQRSQLQMVDFLEKKRGRLEGWDSRGIYTSIVL